MSQHDKSQYGVFLNLEESEFTTNKSKIENIQDLAIAPPSLCEYGKNELRKDCTGGFYGSDRRRKSLGINFIDASSSKKIIESNRIPNLEYISASSDTVSDYQTQENYSQSYLKYISIKLDNLKCFEKVEKQYQNQGVVFSNTIAIEPSNPAFPTRCQKFVLMGSPKSGFMEANFLKPVRSVRVYVTGSQRLEFCAYNSDRNLVDRAILPGANLANSDSGINPSRLLSISGDDICNITFSTFDGQFIVDGFSYSY